VEIESAGKVMASALSAAKASPPPAPRFRVERAIVRGPRPEVVKAPPPADAEPEDLSKQAAKMLATLARRHPMRLTPGQLAMMAGYSRRSSTWAPSLRQLISGGLVTKAQGELAVTAAGLEAAEASPEIPTTPGEEVAMWRERLPKQAAAFLDQLYGVYPNALTREELSERTGYSMTSSTFDQTISTLVRNGLAERREDRSVRASEALFANVYASA
jgi:DNA-binding MarR family transcriptional regulator